MTPPFTPEKEAEIRHVLEVGAERWALSFSEDEVAGLVAALDAARAETARFKEAIAELADSDYPTAQEWRIRRKSLLGMLADRREP